MYINTQYVDGVSLTYGSPRKHLWTFMAGLHESFAAVDGQFVCPCSQETLQVPKIPSFVGNNNYI